MNKKEEYSDEEFKRDAKRYGFSKKFDKKFTKGFDYDKEKFRDKLVIATIGPVGAGKSTLINALYNKDVTKVRPIPGTTLAIKLYPIDLDKLLFVADTPGLFDVNKKLSKDALKFTSRHADFILLLWPVPIQHPPELKKLFNKLRKTKKPLTVLATKIDIIEEKDRKDVVKHVEGLLNSKDILPISAKCGIGMDDLRERIGIVDERKEEILRTKDIREKDKYVARLILWASLGAAGIGAIPLPAADIIPLTALQATTLTKIAMVYGHEVTKARVKSTLMATLTGQVGRTVFRQIIKLIPGFGSAIAAATAGAFTFGILNAGKVYYRSGMSVPIDDLIKIYQDTYDAWKSGKVSKDLYLKG